MLKKLVVSNDKRHLMFEDSTPFFWLGDTAWELFHRLNMEDAEYYLKNRKSKGFNVIQAVALAEEDGIRIPNYYGRYPFIIDENGEYDPLNPDCSDQDSYWHHIDRIIDLAEKMDLFIALLPTWGDKFNQAHGKGPVLFHPSNAQAYGNWIAKRYRDKTNIIWVLGGDRRLETFEHFQVVREMALGIKEVDSNHLITFHPYGGQSSSLNVHNEDWLDFNMIQSGHGEPNLKNYRYVEHDRALFPVKPTIDAEPRYEDHPIFFNPENGYFDDYDARQAAYWAVFSGTLGHTYGHHSVWNMCSQPKDYFIMDWKTALDRPGASQMQYLKELMDERSIENSVPYNDVLEGNYKGANYVQCLKGDNFVYIYIPYGLSVKVNLEKIKQETVNAYWFNPRNGDRNYIATFECNHVEVFNPKSHGRNHDWVLIFV